MKYLLVFITLFSPVFAFLAENKPTINSSVQTQNGDSNSHSIELGATDTSSKKRSPLFALFYIIPSALVLLIVVLSIALSKRLLFEQ